MFDEKDMILEAKHVTRRFPSSNNRTLVACNDVNLKLYKGKTLGLVGESGCGKTISSLCTMGLLPSNAIVDSGRILLGGEEDLLGYDEGKMNQIRGRKISMIFQEPMTALNPTMRIGKQVEEALLLHSRRSRRDRGGWLRMERREQRELALRALEEVELEHPEQLYKKYPHELSGGMRQRVMIAAAIVCRPKLLIADEPTTALDVRTQESILQLLKKLNRKYGMSILFISHNLRVVNTLCRRVLVMKDGQVVEEGDCAEIFENPQSEYTRELIAAIPARTRENRYYELLRRRKKAGEGFAGKDFGSEACKCLL